MCVVQNFSVNILQSSSLQYDNMSSSCVHFDGVTLHSRDPGTASQVLVVVAVEGDYSLAHEVLMTVGHKETEGQNIQDTHV